MQQSEDGHRLWLRYEPVADLRRLAEYRENLTTVVIAGTSPTLQAARAELHIGLGGLLGCPVAFTDQIAGTGAQVIVAVMGTASGIVPIGAPNVPKHLITDLAHALATLGEEGFIVRRWPSAKESTTVIAAKSDVGALYGVFAFLRHLQAHRPLLELDVCDAPKMQLRMLNHWDNLDRTVERGYAGLSLWDWPTLPQENPPVYRDYARANASIGINGVVLTNVNASARVLTAEYLAKVATLANVFRPFGIRVYLTARFNAPIELGGLATADPLVAAVGSWWKAKCREIHGLIPDFGGFLVKANSEGQPGPQDYGRSHADGANLLAGALSASGNGVVLWRAFVYSEKVAEDRAKQAYSDLTPLDGAFAKNVILQVKNGPIDFQPREPFHPLLGAMPKTPQGIEFQITQEYLGQGTHLVYLAPLFKEVLDSNTCSRGDQGAPIAEVVRCMAGVANIGTDSNWCGHPFAQANWFAFGRLAWDPSLRAADIADDWLRMTFTNDQRFIGPVKAMMLASREGVVNYMTPLGLHHIMARDHHHGPGPWVATGRVDWTSVYYHRADATGIGFDRTATGSNAVAQYHRPWPTVLGDVNSCPESLLLWFHHVPWTHQMKSGRRLWDELCLRYQEGVESVRLMQSTWDGVGGFIDNARFEHVKSLLAIQEMESRWWRDACVLYFQTFSKMPAPAGCEPPRESLEFYLNVTSSRFPLSTGGRGREP
jgi:alpha-glucuronidase